MWNTINVELLKLNFRHIIFHDDVGKLYNDFKSMDPDEAIGMVQEQTLKYMRAFGSYQVKAPGTKLGKPPTKE